MAVTAPEQLEKQPDETRVFTLDFSNLMGTSETIASIDTVYSEFRGESTTDLTITNQSISGQTVLIQIAGGTDRHAYRVECTITTSTGQVLQGDGVLKITDK